jgi:hypothetical protein
MTLAIIPARSREQEAVLEWAGQDTEEIADVIWTSAGSNSIWNLADMIEGIRSETWLRAPRTVLYEVVARMLVLRDGYIHCAMSPDAGSVAFEDLLAVANEWGIRVIAGAAEYAWVHLSSARA